MIKHGDFLDFSINQEKLAYPIRVEFDEIDYPYVYSEPLEEVIISMQRSVNCKELFYNLPELSKKLATKLSIQIM